MCGGDESDGANVNHSGHPNNLGKMHKIQLFLRSFFCLTAYFRNSKIFFLAFLNYESFQHGEEVINNHVRQKDVRNARKPAVIKLLLNHHTAKTVPDRNTQHIHIALTNV